MRHRFYLCLVSFLLLIFASTISAQDKEIRYITGHIENVNDNLIILSGNLAFRANEHVTAISMTPATFVLNYDRPEGFVFIKNKKVEVVLMKSSGGKFVVPASKEDLTIYNDGFLYKIDDISKDSGFLTLSNGRQFTLSDKSEKDDINSWKVNDLVIIPNLTASSSPQIINTRTNQRVKINKANKISSAK